MNITCPNCGAPLVYDVETVLWGMAVCRFLFSIYAEIKNLWGLLSGSPHRAFVTI